jgi:hypothetical protein
VIFSWDDVNRDHIARHGVISEEAEYVVRDAHRPYPQTIEDDKFVVWGSTQSGRFLQIIYVLKAPDEVAYESLAVEDWMSVEAGDTTVVVRIIHAMELTAQMKRLLRKRRR